MDTAILVISALLLISLGTLLGMFINSPKRDNRGRFTR